MPDSPQTPGSAELKPLNPAEVRKSLAHREKLPTLPTTFTKVIRVSDDVRSNLTDLIEVIHFDPSLMAGILQAANSAYMGLSEPVEDLSTAVLQLGTAEVKRIALSIGYFNIFTAKGVGVDVLKNIWLHSVTTGLMSVRIATQGRFEFAQHAYVAGLLHDLGKLFFATSYISTYAALRSQVTEGKATGIALEQEIFGLTHLDAAMELCKYWKLPATVVEIATKHHNLSEISEEAKPMAWCVGAANVFAHQMIADEPVDQTAPHADACLAELAALTDQPERLTREILEPMLQYEAERARRFESTTSGKKVIEA